MSAREKPRGMEAIRYWGGSGDKWALPRLFRYDYQLGVMGYIDINMDSVASGGLGGRCT